MMDTIEMKLGEELATVAVCEEQFFLAKGWSRVAEPALAAEVAEQPTADIEEPDH